MILGSWNVNNRVGKVRFRPEAAHAVAALGADVLVLTEFYPQGHEEKFRGVLAETGWPHQLMSPVVPEVANRVLLVSKQPIERLVLNLPTFDHQFPSNLVAASIPSLGIDVLGVRVPAYYGTGRPLIRKAWDWLEATAEKLRHRPAVILGDLNASPSSRTAAGASFRRILSAGWRRAETCEGFTFYGRGDKKSEIDHILASEQCVLGDARVVRQVSGFELAGTAGALSDHAAVICITELVVQEKDL